MKKQNWSVIIITLLIFVIILLAGWTYFSAKKNNNPLSVEQCASEINNVKQNECYEFIFKNNIDVSLCEKMSEANLVFNCFKLLAINTNQPRLCEKAYQKNYCYIDVAAALKNESICDYTEGFAFYVNEDNFQLQKDKCILSVKNN